MMPHCLVKFGRISLHFMLYNRAAGQINLKLGMYICSNRSSKGLELFSWWMFTIPSLYFTLSDPLINGKGLSRLIGINYTKLYYEYPALQLWELRWAMTKSRKLGKSCLWIEHELNRAYTSLWNKYGINTISFSFDTASAAQRAERRTRDREVPGSKLARAIWFFP